MLDWWNAVSLNLVDFLFGWLLVLPRQVAVVAIALITAALFVIIRKWTTNQDRLGRAAADLGRLQELRRQAKLVRDADALARIRATKTQISLIKMKAEGRPLLALMLPLLLLGAWSFQRLEFRPPAAGETIDVIASLPVSAEHDLVHLVPQPGLHAVNGWVQEALVAENDRPAATATWRLQGDAAAEPYPLLIRWKDRTLEHELLVGQHWYSPPRGKPDDDVEIAVGLRETRLLGIPGLGEWLPAWLAGYFLLTVVFALSLKRGLGIY
jgi:uncharacterized membrane protein (DUF106 family)